MPATVVPVPLPEGICSDDLHRHNPVPPPPGDADAPPPDELAPPPAVDPVERVVAELGMADRAIARAITALRGARQDGAKHGMPLERLVALLAERTAADTRFLCRAERTLAHMPRIDAAFADGRLSWSQVRGIITATDNLTVAQIDELDGCLAEEIGTGEPDRIVQRAFGHADAIRFAAAADAEPPPDPGERRRLWMQPDLLGGADLHLYDTLEAVTTVWEAAVAAADAPLSDADGEERPFAATPRQAQLAEGLRRVAAGDAHARTSVSVVVDHTDLAGPAGRALVAWYGGPVRLHPTTTERLLCDAALDTVVVDRQRPVAVADAHAPVTARHRRILHAVDRGCRTPGCSAPPQHCDAHHVIPRSRGGPSSPDNLVLLCRPCHVRLHHHRLRLTLDRHSRAVTLTLPDGPTFTSLPV